jgi:hypothetical protein
MKDARCPKIGCKGEIKDNGFGGHRCRLCDTEFLVNHDPECKHEMKMFHTVDIVLGVDRLEFRCIHCGKDYEEIL